MNLEILSVEYGSLNVKENKPDDPEKSLFHKEC
jgi:hypothetical protein